MAECKTKTAFLMRDVAMLFLNKTGREKQIAFFIFNIYTDNLSAENTGPGKVGVSIQLRQTIHTSC